ncbi:MAG: substrate-binding domain-containing protein [Motiliproteus sp.]
MLSALLTQQDLLLVTGRTLRALVISLVATLLLLTSVNAPAHVGSPYDTIERYSQLHPEQAGLMKAFAAQVEAVATPLSIDQLQPIKIAAVYPGLQQSDFWLRNMKALKLRLLKRNIDFQLHDHPHAVTASIEQQQKAIDDALATDPDYLIMTLDDPRQQRLIEHLLSKPRPKIILLNTTTPLKAWADRQPFIYVGFDHILGSRMLAEKLLLPDNPPRSFGILFRKPGYVSKLRGGTFQDTLHQTKHRLSASYYTKGDSESARIATLSMLQSPDRPDVIFSCSTDVALGAAQAIQQLGLQQQVEVSGWGGGANELAAIKRGELSVTVMRMNDDSGIAIAEAIGNDLNGIAVPQIFSGRLVLITRDHTEQELRLLSETAFRYSGQ